MARSMKVEHVDIYRQLVTTEGVQQHDGWGRKAGDPYRTQKAYGPYFSKNVGGDPWYVPAAKVTIEIQKLTAVAGELKWVTVKKKIRDADEEEGE